MYSGIARVSSSEFFHSKEEEIARLIPWPYSRRGLHAATAAVSASHDTVLPLHIFDFGDAARQAHPSMSDWDVLA